MSDNATSKDIVDLAMNDKPNAAGEAMNDILLNKVGEKVSAMKDQISNDMFGQEMSEPDADAEPVEVQPELDLEPNEDEPDQEIGSEQDTIEEPADEDESEEEEQPEQSDEEEES